MVEVARDGLRNVNSTAKDKYKKTKKRHVHNFIY
jgi:hypothetical protein